MVGCEQVLQVENYIFQWFFLKRLTTKINAITSQIWCIYLFHSQWLQDSACCFSSHKNKIYLIFDKDIDFVRNYFMFFFWFFLLFQHWWRKISTLNHLINILLVMCWDKSIEGLGGKSIPHQTFKCSNMMADIIFILSLFSISFKTEFFVIITRTLPPSQPSSYPWHYDRKIGLFLSGGGYNFFIAFNMTFKTSVKYKFIGWYHSSTRQQPSK